MNYYILIRDEQKGPYTRAQIESMWKLGAITADALYSAEGMTEWRKIEELLTGESRPIKPPPVPPIIGQPTPVIFSTLGRAYAAASRQIRRIPAMLARSDRHQIIILAVSTLLFILWVGYGLQSQKADVSGNSFLPSLLLGPTLGQLFGFILVAGIIALAVLAWRRRQIIATGIFCALTVFCILLLGGSSLAVHILRQEAQEAHAKAAAKEQAEAEAQAQRALALQREQAQRELFRQKAEQTVIKLWNNYLPQSAQSFFDEFHPVGTTKTFSVDGVALTWRYGEPTSDLNDIMSYVVKFTLNWEGPVTKYGHTQIEARCDYHTDRIYSKKVVSSNGITKTDLINGAVELVGAAIKEQQRRNGN